MTTSISDRDIERFIEEDVPYGDLTTHLLGMGDQPGRIIFSTREEALLIARSGADIVQLDKIAPVKLTDVVAAIRAANTNIQISAAGGINESNAAEYAATGIDIIVLSSVYFGKPSDISVSIQPL